MNAPGYLHPGAWKNAKDIDMSAKDKHLDPIRDAIYDYVGDNPLPGTIDITLPSGVTVVIVRESAHRAMAQAYQKSIQDTRDEAEGLTDEMTAEDEAALAQLMSGSQD